MATDPPTSDKSGVDGSVCPSVGACSVPKPARRTSQDGLPTSVTKSGTTMGPAEPGEQTTADGGSVLAASRSPTTHAAEYASQEATAAGSERGNIMGRWADQFDDEEEEDEEVDPPVANPSSSALPAHEPPAALPSDDGRGGRRGPWRPGRPVPRSQFQKGSSGGGDSWASSAAGLTEIWSVKKNGANNRAAKLEGGAWGSRGNTSAGSTGGSSSTRGWGTDHHWKTTDEPRPSSMRSSMEPASPMRPAPAPGRVTDSSAPKEQRGIVLKKILGDLSGTSTTDTGRNAAIFGSGRRREEFQAPPPGHDNDGQPTRASSTEPEAPATTQATTAITPETKTKVDPFGGARAQDIFEVYDRKRREKEEHQPSPRDQCDRPPTVTAAAKTILQRKPRRDSDVGDAPPETTAAARRKGSDAQQQHQQQQQQFHRPTSDQDAERQHPEEQATTAGAEPFSPCHGQLDHDASAAAAAAARSPYVPTPVYVMPAGYAAMPARRGSQDAAACYVPGGPVPVTTVLLPGGTYGIACHVPGTAGPTDAVYYPRFGTGPVQPPFVVHTTEGPPPPPESQYIGAQYQLSPEEYGGRPTLAYPLPPNASPYTGPVAAGGGGPPYVQAPVPEGYRRDADAAYTGVRPPAGFLTMVPPPPHGGGNVPDPQRTPTPVPVHPSPPSYCPAPSSTVQQQQQSRPLPDDHEPDADSQGRQTGRSRRLRLENRPIHQQDTSAPTISPPDVPGPKLDEHRAPRADDGRPLRTGGGPQHQRGGRGDGRHIATRPPSGGYAPRSRGGGSANWDMRQHRRGSRHEDAIPPPPPPPLQEPHPADTTGDGSQRTWDRQRPNDPATFNNRSSRPRKPPPQQHQQQRDICDNGGRPAGKGLSGTTSASPVVTTKDQQRRGPRQSGSGPLGREPQQEGGRPKSATTPGRAGVSQQPSPGTQQTGGSRRRGSGQQRPSTTSVAMAKQQSSSDIARVDSSATGSFKNSGGTYTSTGVKVANRFQLLDSSEEDDDDEEEQTS